ncbi:MAG: dihydrodipicolinate reductase [Thermodesulfobacteriota bacterium]
MEPQNVMINGLPGNLAKMLVRNIVTDDRFQLMPYSLTGPEINDPVCTIGDQAITLIGPDRREAEVAKLKVDYGDFVAIDFTHPTAVNDNADFYCRHHIPFVMGTTGGDRQQLQQRVESAEISAVIAPNMAKQIVGFQAMMAYAAENFPGLFSGYSLEIKESHQQTKADTSGTAKAMVQYFNRLGIDFAETDIIKVRDPAVQKNQLGVPEAYIDGHGWHTYTLVSPDRTATFCFTHNINGRDIYAQGTFDAVLFLGQKCRRGETGRAFTMIDVLKGV